MNRFLQAALKRANNWALLLLLLEPILLWANLFSFDVSYQNIKLDGTGECRQSTHFP
jgi:hypothetical protein